MAQLKSTNISGALTVKGIIDASGRIQTESTVACCDSMQVKHTPTNPNNPEYLVMGVDKVRFNGGYINAFESNEGSPLTLHLNDGSYPSDVTVGNDLKIGNNLTVKNITADNMITGESFNAVSDARLKENFTSITLNKSILDLPTYQYNFIGKDTKCIGCKAQDLMEICPEIVNENSDGILTIQESKIVYLLLEEVKKLRAELNELKSSK